MIFLSKIGKILRKEMKFAAAALIAGVGFTLAFGAYTKAYSENAQAGIAQSVIRFHVLANSDSDADQALKLKVRDAILAELGPALTASASLDETKAYVSANLDEITATAENVVRENGYGYNVTAQLCVDYFPTKSYGDVTLPPGDYEALRVEIGAAQGHNWWCIMFPPLCYVDVTKNSGQDQVPASSKAELQNVLTPDEYSLLTSSDGAVPVKIKFKIVEWWENLLHKNDKPTEIASNQ